MHNAQDSSLIVAFLVTLLATLTVRTDGAAAAFNTWCGPNTFQQPGSIRCEVCGVNSFGSSGTANLISGPALGAPTCFDSFEAIALAINGWSYAPTWNGWTFLANAAGISGSGGPWIPPLANAASGLYFAFIQTPATNTAYAGLSRTISNLLVGTPATISFATSFRNGYGPPPAGSSLVISYGSQTVGTYTTVPGAWSSVSYTFTPNTASATLLFTYRMAGSTPGWSISIDMVSVNQYCPVGFYTEQITGSCQSCSGTTMAAGCFDSFEGSTVAAGGFSYNPGPSFNSWNFGACAGIGGIGSPWDSSPAGSGGGNYYAYIQSTCSLSRTVTSGGTWAIVEFHYAFRAGTQNAYINPLSLSWNGITVWSTIYWHSGWSSAIAQFAVSAGSGSLAFSHTNLKVGDATMLIDYVSINFYCAPGTYRMPDSSCAQCPVGQFLTSPMTPQGRIVSCSPCPAGSYASTTGSTTCTACPVGTYSTGTGNTACTACSSGTSSLSGASSCSSTCPAGSYNDGSGSCIACAAGTYSSSTTATSVSTCIACGAGTFSPPGASSCASICPDGFYSSWGVSRVCFPCLGAAFSSDVTVAGQGMSSSNKCVENFEASSSITAPGGFAYLPGRSTYISLGTNNQGQIPWNKWIWNAGGISAQGTSPWDTSPSTIAPGGGGYYAYLQANPGQTNPVTTAGIALPSATLTRALTNLGSSGYVVVSYAYTSRNAYAPSTGSALVSTIAGVTIAASNVFLTSWSLVGPIVVALPYGALMQNSAMLQFQLNQAAGDCAVLIDVITVTGACAPSTYLAIGTTTCLPCGSGTYATAGLSACLFCPVPSVLNAAYAVYANANSNGWIYAFQCNKGFWDTPVNKTCATASGAVSGSTISCKACTAPSVSSPVQSAGNYLGDASVWSLTCQVGFTGTPTTRTCSTSTGVLSGPLPTCNPCSTLGGGYYCVGGLNNLGPVPSSPGAYPCPAGTFGLPGVNLGSSVCSGQCQEGYYCPLASISSDVQPCGSAAVYCPTGSGAPLPVSANHYSTPVSAPATRRTGQSPCPQNQQCLNGVILAPVDFTQNCLQSTGGATTFGVNDGTTGTTFGPQLSAATPGYAGVTTYSISDLQTADATCSAAALASGTGLSTTTISTMGQLSVSSLYTISSTSCQRGFSFLLTAMRADGSRLNATCRVNVEVLQVIRPPTFIFCGPISIEERAGVGAITSGGAITASTTNYGTTVFYQFAPGFALAKNFSINTCTGYVSALQSLYWNQGTSYILPIIAINDGTAIALGTANTSCTATLNVVQVPLPPVPTTTTFNINELSSIGTFIGNLGFVDPAGYPISNVRWSLIPATIGAAIGNVVSVSSDELGTLNVSVVVDTLVMAKTTWIFVVNASNQYTTGSYSVSITFNSVPRPPTVTAQVVSVPESSLPGSTFTPGLVASSLSNLALTYSVSPSTVFGINSTSGVLFLQAGQQLVYKTQSTYALQLTVQDTGGRATNVALTINIIESAKAPAFNTQPATWAFSVIEGSAPGAVISLPSGVLGSTKTYSSGVQTYKIISTSPLPSGAPPPFTINALTGDLSIGLVPGNALIYDRTLTYTQGPATFLVTIAAIDASSGLNSTGLVNITIDKIAPRCSAATVNVSTGASPGSFVFTLSTLVWNFYGKRLGLFDLIPLDTLFTQC